MILAPGRFPTREAIRAWWRSPVKAATWLATAQVAAGGVVGLAGLAAVAAPIAFGTALAKSVVAPVVALIVILAVVRTTIIVMPVPVSVWRAGARWTHDSDPSS